MNIEPLVSAAEFQDIASVRRDQNQRDVACYIADMLTQLRSMAEDAQLTKAVKSIEAAYCDVYSAMGTAIRMKGRPPQKGG